MAGIGLLADERTQDVDDAGMGVLYEKYRAFVGHVYDKDPSFCRSYPDFVAWWESLPEAVRESARAKYERGFSGTGPTAAQ